MRYLSETHDRHISGLIGPAAAPQRHGRRFHLPSIPTPPPTNTTLVEPREQTTARDEPASGPEAAFATTGADGDASGHASTPCIHHAARRPRPRNPRREAGKGGGGVGCPSSPRVRRLRRPHGGRVTSEARRFSFSLTMRPVKIECRSSTMTSYCSGVDDELYTW